MSIVSDETQPAGSSASRLIIIGILLLAGLLRFHRLDLIGVTNETAYQELTATTALSMEDGEWPLAGPPTEEVRSSAFLVTAVAISKLVWWSPYSGVVFVIGLNLLAIWLLYRMCIKQFGMQVGLIATMLYAVSPWGVLYSRFLLSSSCLSFFSIWLIHLSFNWLEERGKQQLFMMVLLSLLIPQIHYSGVWVPLWLIAVLCLGRKQISYVAFITGGLVGASLWAPWIEFQRVQHWEELRNWIGQVFQSPGEHGTALFQSIDSLQSMLHSSGCGYWFGGNPSDWPAYFPGWMRWGMGITTLILAGILLFSMIQILVRRTDRRLLLLLLWISLPILIGTLLRTGVRPENLLIAYPIPFVLVAVSMVQLAAKSTHKVHFALPFAILVIAIIDVCYLASLKRFVGDGQMTASGHYSLSYSQRRSTVQFVLEKAGSFPVRIVGPYSGWYPAYEYVLMFEQQNESIEGAQTRDQQLIFWIDEQAPSEDMSAIAWRNQKERQINLSISEYLLTAPNWVIEDHWIFEHSQIYLLQYKIKKAFQ